MRIQEKENKGNTKTGQTASFPFRQWCPGKCSTASSGGALMHSMCQFPWCKRSHGAYWRLPTWVTYWFTKFLRISQDLTPELVRASLSAPLHQGNNKLKWWFSQNFLPTPWKRFIESLNDVFGTHVQESVVKPPFKSFCHKKSGEDICHMCN